MRVLVVDDDPQVLEFVRLVLRRLDCDVLTAISGIEGEVLARDQKPDVILLDISMPVQDGWHTLKNLRAASFEGRVFMVSALPALDNEFRALREGAHGFMEKRKLTEDLRDLVRSEAESGA